MASRAATADDVQHVTRVIEGAFAADPIWGLAFSRTDGRKAELEPIWRLFVEGGLRFGTTRMATDGAAVSVWLPPGEDELSAEQSATFHALLAETFDPVAIRALEEVLERFETSRAGRPDHYYLSLLATDQAFQGRGRGQILLAEDLAIWDAQGIPCYLESTNPANDHRYARAGFRHDGGFQAVRDDAWISAMWREVGGSS